MMEWRGRRPVGRKPVSREGRPWAESLPQQVRLNTNSGANG